MGTAPRYVSTARTFAGQTPPVKLVNPNSWIDTSSRLTVANSYLNTFLPTTTVPTGWTGNVSTGNAGSTTQAYRDSVLTRVNWFRQMAGVPTPITFSTSNNQKDQLAAMMMSANGDVSAQPPSNWLYYSASGAEAAAHSNLCLDLPYLSDPGCVSQYVQDYGATNPGVGHRRWLFYPQTQTMGTGDVQPPYPLAFVNSLWVVDDLHLSDTRPQTRDGFVAWPPKGYVPYQLVPGRWSFSYPNADFTNATVVMQRGGGPVTVRLETPQQGFGENTLVWVPDSLDASVSTHWPQPLADTPISVGIAHVMINGVDSSFAYTVNVFDPNYGVNVSGHITKGGVAFGGATVTLSGGPTATADSAGAYTFSTVPFGTYLIVPTLAGYAFSPSSRSVSASTTIADFTAQLCDYSGIGGTLNANARAGTGTYTVTLANGCPWTATTSAPWLTVSSATTSGYGPLSVTYSYTTNNGLARSAALTIAGRAVNIVQPSAGQAPGPVNVAVYFNGKWTVDANGNGVFDSGDKYFQFQIYGAGDKPVAGDWNGDGHVKAGAWSNGFWALDYNGNGQWDGVPTDKFYAFGGNVGEIPIVGDWNGDGRAKIGYYWRGFWALDYNGNGQWDGLPTDKFYALGGNPGEIPIVGDWNGDGRTKVGFFLNGLWVLDMNGNGQWDGPNVDRYTTYTIGAGEKPVVGDWTGTGTTKIGLNKNGFWLLDFNGDGVYQNTDGFFGLGGNQGEVPIVGDWNGDGRTKIGFFLFGFWALDYNGNGRWDGLGPNNDRFIALGGNPGETPVQGKW